MKYGGNGERQEITEASVRSENGSVVSWADGVASAALQLWSREYKHAFSSVCKLVSLRPRLEYCGACHLGSREERVQEARRVWSLEGDRIMFVLFLLVHTAPWL